MYSVECIHAGGGRQGGAGGRRARVGCGVGARCMGIGRVWAWEGRQAW